MGMTDSRSARSTPILSAPTNPAQSTLNPEAQSIVQHQPEGYREEVMVGQRPGQKKTNCLPAINNHTADETCSGYPAVCCSAAAGLQQKRFYTEIKITVLTISR